MSGTSLDGVDGVLAVFEPQLQVLAHVHRPFSQPLKQELLSLVRPGGVDELHRAARAGIAVSERYAQVVQALLSDAALVPGDVHALGAHGQTVRHQPADSGANEPGYTLQLLQPALLAERTGIDVVCDFRSRDVAAGGQGAPLVPGFHAAVFARAGEAVAVLNLGGIANLTLVDEGARVQGFDCGPGNALMDEWVQRHRGEPFDAHGAWAAKGQVLPALLASLRSEAFLQLPPPKSTGRELFHEAWLAPHLRRHADGARTQDVQATLAEFTVWCAVDALHRHAAPTTRRLLVCGGGALNHHLMHRLVALLPGWQVTDTDAAGLPAQQVEAGAFAWLAKAFVEAQPANRPEVTGARGARRLGALYPAR
ncbi:anhydro-N-acetylmuramic acid kinase [Aquabacterium sp. J223]|nr:anhydro-N-acetylmuramic acid kinase [Aquabacterium sp. J223]